MSSRSTLYSVRLTVELVVPTVAGGGKVQSLKVAAVGLQSMKMKRSVMIR